MRGMGDLVPLYVSLAQRVRQDIRTHTYEPGDVLPGERDLAPAYGVSPDTVRRAMRILREEGTVTVKRGIGHVVGRLPEQEPVRLGKGDEITARLPTREESARLGVAEGVWVLAVRHEDGTETLYDANRARLVPGPAPRSED